MESTNVRSWVGRIGIAVLFIVLGALGSCDTESPTGVAPQEMQVSATADSTSHSTEGACHLVDGQWICN